MTEPLSFEALQSILSIKDQTVESLRLYDETLRKWQKRFNLVGPSTLEDSVRRHFHDSAQLMSLIDTRDNKIVDLGSGAGFPGLVLSLLGAGEVHLVESDANKCEFLRQVIRLTKASATIHNVRIENYQGPKATIITSRACAPLNKLMELSKFVCTDGTRMLFLKGRNWQDELTQTQALCHIDVQHHQSACDPEGVILEITGFTDQ